MKMLMFLKGAILYVTLIVAIFALALQPELGSKPAVAATTMTLFIAWAMVNMVCRLHGKPLSLFASTLLSGAGILFFAKGALQYSERLSWLDLKTVSLASFVGCHVEAGTFTNVVMLSVSIVLVCSLLHATDLIGKSCSLRVSRISNTSASIATVCLVCLPVLPSSAFEGKTKVAHGQLVVVANQITQLATCSTSTMSPDYSLPAGFSQSDLAEYLLPAMLSANTTQAAAETDGNKITVAPVGKEEKLILLATSQQEIFSLPEIKPGIQGPDPSLFPTK